MKKKTNEEFLKEVYDLVGDEYKVLGEYINSSTKIKMLHTICGNIYYVKPNSFLTGKRCPFCSRSSLKTQKKFEDEVYDLTKGEYKVLGEYEGTDTKIKMLHTKCGNEFATKPHSFLHGSRCPFCCSNNQQVLVGFNSMWDTNPELAKLLLNPEDGYKYTQYSEAKLKWKCRKCGNIINNISVDMVNRRGLSCHRCSDGVSYPSRLMFSVLTNLNVDFQPEKHFKWCRFVFKGKNYTGRYDFYFIYNNLEYIVEMDGYFHFNNNLMNGRTGEDSHQIDLIKDKLAIKNNILPIRINCEKAELEYIKKEIKNSDLNNIFDLSNIDWEECQKQSLTSLKIQACELWKEHHDTKTIANIMKKHKCTIYRWLKSCSSAGLSDYDPVFEYENKSIKTSHKIVCLNTNEIFNSVSEVSKKYHINRAGISRCCSGKQKFAGKLADGTELKWKYYN